MVAVEKTPVEISTSGKVDKQLTDLYKTIINNGGFDYLVDVDVDLGDNPVSDKDMPLQSDIDNQMKGVKSIGRKWIKRGAAVGTVFTAGGMMAGCVTGIEQQSTMPNQSAEQTIPGETGNPSQTDAQKTPNVTTDPTGEATASQKPPETSNPTVEPTEKPTAKPTIEPTNNPTVGPTETIDPNETEQNPPPTEAPTATVTPEATATPLSEYDQRLLEIYGPELVARGCKSELEWLCSGILGALDMSNSYNGEMFIKSGKLTRDQVFDYGKEGTTTVFGIIEFDDNKDPAFAIFADEDVVGYVNQACANWEVDVPNFKRILANNGMKLINQQKIFPKKGMDSYYDGNGLFTLNCNSADKKRLGSKQMIFTIQKHLGVEHFGIKALNLGGSYAIPNNSGYIKQELFEIWCKYLYMITGKKVYYNFSIEAAAHKKDFIDKSQPQAELVKQVIDQDLIPIDKPWSEIVAVVNGN